MQIPVLVGIMSTLLASDEVITAQYLAEKFELSRRSVYRYINMLSEGGVPIESHLGRNGGWSIIETYKLKSMYFTEDEYSRILLAVQSFGLQDDVTKTTADKLTGLKRGMHNACVLKSEQLVVDASEEEIGDAVNKLSSAIGGKKLVEIEYHSKEGEDTVRTVEPYSLVLKNGLWYVYCYCRMRKDFRYFKVSRIVKMQVLQQGFTPRSYVVNSNEIETNVIRGKEMCEVILTLDKSALTCAEEWLGVSNVAKLGEGYVAKATLPYDNQLVNNVISLGNGVRVQTPERLRLAVVERCKEISLMNGAQQ